VRRQAFGVLTFIAILVATNLMFSKAWASTFSAFELSTVGAMSTRIVVTAEDSIWFIETNANRIGKVLQDEKRVVEYTIPTMKSIPSDLVVTGSGMVWFTEQDANQLGMFDPVSLAFKEYDIPTFASLPFRIAWDGADSIWFTEHYGNKLGRFNIRTETFTEFSIPTANSRPSGIVVDREGHIWFLQMQGNKLARLNPDDGSFAEYDLPTPFSVTSDLVIDKSGRLWFAARSRQELNFFDISKKSFESFPIPGGGVIDGLAVDGVDRIHFTLGRNGKMGVFNPANKAGSKAIKKASNKSVKHGFTIYDALTGDSRPFGVGVDSDGNIWYTDVAKNVLVKVKGEVVSQLLNR
jgi:virginiamycin B lyase